MINIRFILFKQPLDIIVIDGGKDTGVNQEEEDNANGKKKYDIFLSH